ncbi:MAG TPA: MFS transporter [Sphingomonas sp.]|jgi:ACS family hexuronate transporter-like MFS transporter|uniref:MFS transporter n=1 Tax=Sphingomonas sp. TaxID=28214 RepID=UPI002ED9CD86
MTGVQAGQDQRWLITVLIFVAIMLNYVDRQMIALLKPTLQAEFSWSDRDYSHMASAFQFAAAVAFLGTGWFIDRVGLRRGFAIGVGAWSIAGMAHAVVASVGGFVAVRAALGVAESIGTPAMVKSAATYYTPQERSKILGIGNMAPNIGAVATPLLIPPLALWLGWKAAFLIAGGLGLLWVVVWLAVRVPPQPAAPAIVASAPRGWTHLLRDRRQWAIITAKALTDQVWWFLLFFMPDLFSRMFGLSQGTLGLPVALVYAMAAFGALSGGWLPSRLIARGASANAARKGSMLFYACLIVPVPLVLLVASPWTAALLLGLALFAHQGFSTNIFGFTTDMFPARIVGSAIGIAAFAGNLAGMGMIEFAGWSLDRGHGYAPMLFICAGAYLAALLAIQLLVPRIVIPEQEDGVPAPIPMGH